MVSSHKEFGILIIAIFIYPYPITLEQIYSILLYFKYVKFII